MDAKQEQKLMTSIFYRLQWFLDRIANHPLLQASPATRVFLESRDFVRNWVGLRDEKKEK
ncbi:hypothetical protein BC940DRAFT_297955 [Gongronella butleri]|nr:hypothetical protein BC940DRAFT_297955 [Gongronella butleri]